MHTCSPTSNQNNVSAVKHTSVHVIYSILQSIIARMAVDLFVDNRIIPKVLAILHNFLRCIKYLRCVLTSYMNIVNKNFGLHDVVYGWWTANFD